MPTSSEIKRLEQKQKQLNKLWKKRSNLTKTHINITIPSDVKKKMMFESMADQFRVNRTKTKTPRKVSFNADIDVVWR